MTLKEIREKINLIDEKLVALLKERMDCSLEVAKIKEQDNLPVFCPDREQEILTKVETEGKEHGIYIRNVYTKVLTESRDLQSTFLKKDEK